MEREYAGITLTTTTTPKRKKTKRLMKARVL